MSQKVSNDSNSSQTGELAPTHTCFCFSPALPPPWPGLRHRPAKPRLDRSRNWSTRRQRECRRVPEGSAARIGLALTGRSLPAQGRLASPRIQVIRERSESNEFWCDRYPQVSPTSIPRFLLHHVKWAMQTRPSHCCWHSFSKPQTRS